MIDLSPEELADERAFRSQSHFKPCQSPSAARERNLALLNSARAFLDGQSPNPATLRRLIHRAIWAAEENMKVQDYLQTSRVRSYASRADKDNPGEPGKLIGCYRSIAAQLWAERYGVEDHVGAFNAVDQAAQQMVADSAE